MDQGTSTLLQLRLSASPEERRFVMGGRDMTPPGVDKAFDSAVAGAEARLVAPAFETELLSDRAQEITDPVFTLKPNDEAYLDATTRMKTIARSWYWIVSPKDKKSGREDVRFSLRIGSHTYSSVAANIDVAAPLFGFETLGQLVGLFSGALAAIGAFAKFFQPETQTKVRVGESPSASGDG